MATNEILRFAETDTGTNLLTQSEYAADSQRPIGNQPGVARSKLVNKALRQASLIAAGLAEYIADNQANNVTDALTPQNIADYLQAAITGALGVTPPQFDNDTSLATTAFVQRALGNFQGVVYKNASTVLTAAQAGSFVVGYGSSAITYTLPLVSSVQPGVKFTIYNITNHPLTVARSGSDVIGLAGNTATSVSVLPGDHAVFAYTGNGTTWELYSGELHLKYASSFGASLAANGYQKLPSGLILQWGKIEEADGNLNGRSYSFPLTFPNAPLSFSAIALLAGDTYNAGAGVYLVTSLSASQFRIASSNGGSTRSWVYWIAIGY